MEVQFNTTPVFLPEGVLKQGDMNSTGRERVEIQRKSDGKWIRWLYKKAKKLLWVCVLDQ